MQGQTRRARTKAYVPVIIIEKHACLYGALHVGKSKSGNGIARGWCQAESQCGNGRDARPNQPLRQTVKRPIVSSWVKVQAASGQYIKARRVVRWGVRFGI
ncbi:hypothetical protein PGQ11_002646 [Apiospora arundinis]|uniref:Uncharacterized protein n=1 Tax=Apiospora arundinis TaxID=335852 RepID=A0ABR2JIQ9_9PEZI